MPSFLVTAHRSTVYQVDAENEQAAIDAMIDGDAKEVDETTHRIEATPNDQTLDVSSLCRMNFCS